MKCLFCGKDLPLFKRLAGAEFCSDEHRQQYREEYSELALSRLAQQKSTANKPGLAAKPQPPTPAATPSRAPKPSAPPSMKPAESKADGKKTGPRSVMESRTGEPKIVTTPLASPKPALLTRASRPLIASTPGTLPSTAPEPVRGDPAKLPITPAGARPPRSVVPLQETIPLKVTETRISEAKAATPKTPQTVRAMPPEPVPQARPSAHTPLRLELPVGPAPQHPHSQPSPEGLLVPTADVRLPESLDAPAPFAVEAVPVHEEAIDQTAVDEAPIEFRPSPGAKQRPGGEPRSADTPKATAPAPIADLVPSQPPCAEWKGGVHATNLELVPALQPVFPRGETRVRPANLNGAAHLSSGEILNPSAPPLRASPVRVEIRDFARMAPILEFKPIVDAPHVPAAGQAVVLSFDATALLSDPRLWAEPAREFGLWPDLREQAAFLEALVSGLDLMQDSATPSHPVPATPRTGVNGKASSALHHVDLSHEPQLVTLARNVAPEGVPGGKAKPVQMFTSTLRESVQASIPNYDVLPLRATMMLGPVEGSTSATVAAGDGSMVVQQGQAEGPATDGLGD